MDGRVRHSGAAAAPDYRKQVITETVLTERNYLQSLASLCDLKRTIVNRRLLEEAVVQRLFSSVDLIYELHQRFSATLEGIEVRDAWAQKLREYASLFVDYEGDFGMYWPYIANLSMFDRLAYLRGVLSKIQPTGHDITSDLYVLDGYMLRPYSRFAKYSVLMKGLLQDTTEPEERALLQPGADASERILQRGLEVTETTLREIALERLPGRLESWKDIENKPLGMLHLHGFFVAEVRDHHKPRKYEVFLFEHWLLLFKPRSGGSRQRDLSDDEFSRSKIQLTGRLAMRELTRVARGKDVLPGSEFNSQDFQLWVGWRDFGGEKVVSINFRDETRLAKWFNKVDYLHRAAR